MLWTQLLSLNRYGDLEDRKRHQQDEARLGLDVDFDRIVFSREFRSLQDKTQVVPLPSQVGAHKGFVHTRLTHSLEVASVGRSLGRMAGLTLIGRHPELEREGYRFTDFGAIVSAACLAHDIGNPPFGHGGEKAIGSFYSQGEGRELIERLNARERLDLQEFEGNANGFHLLCSDRPGMPGGLRLSYATLGAFIKYPRESIPDLRRLHFTDKKYGIFQKEREFYEQLAGTLGLQARGIPEALAHYRSPLTYLVEAADDICYTIIDAEDGVAMSLLDPKEMEGLFTDLLGGNLNTAKLNELSGKSERMAYIRSVAINYLTAQCVEIFLDSETALLSGQLNSSLLDISPSRPVLEEIIAVCVGRMYRSDEVVQKELRGYAVLTRLLRALCPLYLRYATGDEGYSDRLLLRLIRDPFLQRDTSPYDSLLNATSYVASLSDSAAVQLDALLAGGQQVPF